jgi:hypothetical protein
MRISEIIKCASDLAELEKQAMVSAQNIAAGLNFVRSGAKVAPKLIGPGVGKAVQKPFTGLIGPGLRGTTAPTAVTLPGASYGAPAATDALETAAKRSLFTRFKDLSPAAKTGIYTGGAGLVGGGLGALMNSGSGYDDAMNDAQLMMQNQQAQYQEALARLQNRGLFDRIANTGF